MNRLRMITMCLLAVMATSLSVKAQEVTITLMPGWNWISVPLMDTLDFQTAMGSFTPVQGDIIKSQWSNASYMNGQWRGPISQFYPGYGYMYYSNRPMPVMVTFTAQQPAPQVIVTTMEPADITSNSATGGGLITTDAYVFAKGICWATHADPTPMDDNHSENGNGAESFTAEMTDLSQNTTYYVRAYAVTQNGIVYGNEVSFTTIPIWTIEATPNPTDGGTITGTGDYEQNAICNLTATPNEGFVFTNWTENGEVVSIEASYTFTVNADRMLVANFTVQSFTINISANPSDGGSVSGGDSYYYGQSCTVSATANMGHTFSNWTENDSVVSTNANYTFTVNANRTLVANFEQSYPIGAINGLFSVSESHQVYFSQGNLQYIGSASTPYWKFAENQCDYLGNNGQGSPSSSVDRDLFGWGTSGWSYGHENNSFNYPWITGTSEYASWYGPGVYNDLGGSFANADWGVYNPISNGGNQPNQWRTLSGYEWNYVFKTRTTPSGIRYAKANVNGVNGVILLPDDWNITYYSLNNTNQNVNYTSNIITATQWNTLEQHGAVFLPAAGNRHGTNLSYLGSRGYYWSTTHSGSDQAIALIISEIDIESILRSFGFSVRLVCDAE